MSHQIYIGIGSNIERDKHVSSGLNALAEVFGRLTLSNVYESEAIGFDGSNFYNLVVGAETTMGLADVSQQLKTIETANGKLAHEKKFAPRTLDLDLLLYDDLVTSSGVELPRPEIEYNAFVLLPLSEIAPNLLHPVTQKTIAQMWQDYDQSRQTLWKIAFTWSNDRQ